MDVPMEILEAIDMSLDTKYKHEDSTLLETLEDIATSVAEFIAYLFIMLGSLAIVVVVGGYPYIWGALKLLEFLVIQFPLGG